ncbi:MAG TPA: TonB-dependent receptor [Gemmatimonadaceae bacterium]
MNRWLVLCLLALAALPARPVAAQTPPTGRITGVVTAAEGGRPLAGAHVVVTGTRTGAVTGPDGRYLLTVAPGTYSIRASMIGFGSVVMEGVPVAADSSTTADFVLKHQAVTLEQVVVVGYGSQAKKDVTGAVAVVSGEDLNKQATSNVADALKGRIAGVDVVTTGNKPGDGVRVRIRGDRSLKASNDPLYVLDGIPMSGGIGDLNTGDIESIQILKDASATAIYGSRGANGVVLITTRSGKAGRSSFTYDTYAGYQKAQREVDMMTGPEFAQMKREAFRTVGSYKCDPGVVACDSADAKLFYPQELAAIRSGRWTNWQDLILRTGAQVSHQLRMQGGDERTRFALSASQLGQEGIIKAQDFTRRSMRLNFDHHASPRFHVGSSTTLMRSLQNLGRGDGVYGEALGVNPLGMPYDSSGRILFKPVPDGQRVNPLSDIANYKEDRSRTRVFGTLFSEYEALPGLTWRLNFGPDLTFYRRGQYLGPETSAKQGSGADAEIEESKTFAYVLDNILTYRRTLGNDHRFDGTFLYSIEKNRSEGHFTGVTGVPYESQLYYNLGTALNVSEVSSGLSEWALQSYMGRLNYAFKDRYLATLTTRIDGSSRLAAGHKYSTFPSIALGWRLSDEPFMQRWNLFNELKLRGSYGQTGNTSISPYQTEGALTRTIYTFGDLPAIGFRPSLLPNPDLRWETTRQYDAGIEWAALNSRLSGTVDAYWAKTTDLLMDRQLPGSTGYSSIVQNIGATRNTGVEIGLSTVNLTDWHGLRWTSDFNWSANRNRIVSLFGGKDDPGNAWFIGRPISVYYDYRFIGIWQTADSALAYSYGKQKPGEIRVQDVNNDGTINDKDRVILGSAFPAWTGSASTRLDYRGFDLSAMAVTRQKVMVKNTFRTSNSQLFGRYNNLRVNYWLPTNPSQTDPRPNSNQESPAYGDTRAYEDGSFVRIRNITLGYTASPALAARLRTQSLRAYVTAQDPFLFTHFRGLDPESRTSSGVPSYYTLLAGVTLGL